MYQFNELTAKYDTGRITVSEYIYELANKLINTDDPLLQYRIQIELFNVNIDC